MPCAGKEATLRAPFDEQTEQPLDVRHVTDQHDVSGLTHQLVGHPFRRVGWLEATRG